MCRAVSLTKQGTLTLSLWVGLSDQRSPFAFCLFELLASMLHTARTIPGGTATLGPDPQAPRRWTEIRRKGMQRM